MTRELPCTLEQLRVRIDDEPGLPPDKLIAWAVAEIEQLRRLVDEREADLGRMHGETSAEIGGLKAGIKAIAEDPDTNIEAAVYARNLLREPKPCSRCGLWPEPKDPCGDMACPAGAKP